MDTTTRGEVILSKGMMLISIATGMPVQMNQPISTQEGRVTVLGGSAPVYDGAAGRVQVRREGGVKDEFPPNRIGLAWRVCKRNRA